MIMSDCFSTTRLVGRHESVMDMTGGGSSTLELPALRDLES